MQPSKLGAMTDDPTDVTRMLERLPEPLRTTLATHEQLLPQHVWSQCPEGWAVIVRDALLDLNKLATETGAQLRIVQFKEKVGGLRLYLRLIEPDEIDQRSDGVRRENSPTKGRLLGKVDAPVGSIGRRAREIVEGAERLAAQACQQCGKPGIQRSTADGIATVCNEHAGGSLPRRTPHSRCTQSAAQPPQPVPPPQSTCPPAQDLGNAPEQAFGPAAATD